MSEIDNNLRNLGIVAHVDAGKTTITEHMLYLSGETRSLGRVDDGTARTDWLDVERKRGISVRSASTVLKWKETDINLIDTPGHIDFAAEVERTLRVLDGAILVVTAVDDVQAHTETLWKALRSLNIPTIIFINKIDRLGADTSRIVKRLRKVLSPDILSLQKVTGEATREPEVSSVWSDEEAIAGIFEFLAERDEGLLERFINEEKVTPQELQTKITELTHQQQLFPLFCGSAIHGVGMEDLLDGVVDYLPTPAGQIDQPLSGVVFKMEKDDSMGKLAYVRLYNGQLENRDTVYNHTQDREEKVTQIRKVFANKHRDVGHLSAGDIGVICGFNHVQIGDVLGDPEPVPGGYTIANALLKAQVYPVDDSEYTRLAAALQELTDEDPLLGLEWIKEERELHIKIMGTIQLEVLSSLLNDRFDLEVEFDTPSVIYKETPSQEGIGYVRYTMPKPCWAVLKFQIEPGERGSGLVYESQVSTDVILARYQNQVKQALPDALEQGMHGWEVTDLKVTLIDGEYHVEHTHPLDFVVATPMGIMDGLANIGTTLLEPIVEFEISVPEDVGGKVLGDLVQMRGEFESPIIKNGIFHVTGKVPVATSMDYPIKLSSIAGGRGKMKTQFAGYQECPLELGKTTPYRGINPLDRSKYILSIRNAL